MDAHRDCQSRAVIATVVRSRIDLNQERFARLFVRGHPSRSARITSHEPKGGRHACDTAMTWPQSGCAALPGNPPRQLRNSREYETRYRKLQAERPWAGPSGESLEQTVTVITKGSDIVVNIAAPIDRQSSSIAGTERAVHQRHEKTR